MEGKPISDELLSILVCPETKEAVSLISDQELQKVNEQINQGLITKKSGSKVEDKISAGLIRADRKILYPIVEGIPVMLAEEALVLNNI